MKLFKKVAKPIIPGTEQTWQWHDHQIVYSVIGDGAPLLLIHGINAAAWSYEFHRNIEALAQFYKVYVPDLPGFGRSERKTIAYTADHNINFIADFANYIHEREEQIPTVIGSSLSAAHLIGAVERTPKAFGALVLISPTGLERLDFAPKYGLHKALMSWFGSVLFWLLSSKLSTRLFLKRDGYHNPKAIDNALIEAYYWATHQPNAKFAPIAFISGLLNHAVKDEWSKIQQPVLIVWGSEAKITPAKDAEMFLRLRPHTAFKLIEDARLVPHDEKAAEFNAVVLKWLHQIKHSVYSPL